MILNIIQKSISYLLYLFRVTAGKASVSDEDYLGTVTSITNESYTTASDSFTATKAGLYSISVSGTYHADDCPAGTGRYALTVYKNGSSIASGGYRTMSLSDITVYLAVGDKVTAYSQTSCSDCSYTWNSYSCSMSINIWVFNH
jgi:hypothetical protein